MLRKRNVEFNDVITIYSLKNIENAPLNAEIHIFDSKKEVTLTTDASEHAVVVIILEGSHPLIYLSRKLMAAETIEYNLKKGSTSNSVEHGNDVKLRIRTEMLTKVRPQAVTILIQTQKRIAKS